MLEILITLATAAVLVLAGLWLLQRRLIYFPVADVPPIATTLPGGRIIPINTGDGLTLTGWFLSPLTPTAAVLVLNGNAGNRVDRAALASALVDSGYEVLLFDYRGYGGNEGGDLSGVSVRPRGGDSLDRSSG